MNTVTRLAGEALIGLGIGMDVDTMRISHEHSPAHVALVLGSVDSETPAPPAKVEIPMNRSDRRQMGERRPFRIVGVTFVSEQSHEQADVEKHLQIAREAIAARTSLMRKNRR